MNTYGKGKRPRAGNGRATKYNNHRIKTVHGWFDSKGELQRWLFLLDAERRGVIADLKRQVEFPLDVKNMLVCTYVADFVYRMPGRDTPGDWIFKDTVVEDFKGMVTDIFRLKAKLFRAVYGFPIQVVKSPTENPCKVVDPVTA